MIKQEKLLFIFNVILEKVFFNHKKINKKIKSILLIKLDEIGDMAASTHIFESLKKEFPNSQITVLCKSFNNNLIENDPNVNKIINKIEDWNQHYNLILEMRGNWKTFFKTFKYFPKYRKSRALVRFKNKGNQLHEYDTNISIIENLVSKENIIHLPKLYSSPLDLDHFNHWKKNNEIKKFVIFHIGARRKLRQWDVNNYVACAQFIKEKFNYDIVWAGGIEDVEEIEKTKQLLSFKTFNIASFFSLSSFVLFCKNAQLYIGNESGPLQIAATTQTPIIALFGPGVPHVFYPKGSKVKIFHPILECNPCDQINCKYKENPCINRTNLESVLQEVCKFLE